MFFNVIEAYDVIDLIGMLFDVIEVDEITFLSR